MVKNVPFKNRKVNRKWTLPQGSFIIRPNILGNQK